MNRLDFKGFQVAPRSPSGSAPPLETAGSSRVCEVASFRLGGPMVVKEKSDKQERYDA